MFGARSHICQHFVSKILERMLMCDIWNYLRSRLGFPQKIIKICTPDFSQGMPTRSPINGPYGVLTVSKDIVFSGLVHKREKSLLQKFLSPKKRGGRVKGPGWKKEMLTEVFMPVISP